MNGTQGKCLDFMRISLMDERIDEGKKSQPSPRLSLIDEGVNGGLYNVEALAIIKRFSLSLSLISIFSTIVRHKSSHLHTNEISEHVNACSAPSL